MLKNVKFHIKNLTNINIIYNELFHYKSGSPLVLGALIKFLGALHCMGISVAVMFNDLGPNN